MNGFALFPGLLVCLKGTNPTGAIFNVETIVEIQMPPPAATSLSCLRKYYPDPKKPMAILVAAGPFTLDSDLEFEPLRDFVAVVEREKPDLCVLLGPFLGSENALVKEGMVEEGLEEVFREKVGLRVLRASVVLS